ncbi:MAG TPA: type II toxin-antitoxin system VapC family toxin [Thermomicrobiales bacterium]|nr:type II toxin-antitoxin system VapC family toxin [Thermomicrobiales bacterium]
MIATSVRERPPLVVDASVVVKWLLPEELSARAHALLDAAVREERMLAGVPSLPVDVAQVIHQRGRRGDLTPSETDAALDLLGRLAIATDPPPEIIREAVAFARDSGIKQLHDAQQIVLARLLTADLWTADPRLYKNTAGVIPWVRWVGDFESL